MTGAIAASTLTTICVFLPIVFTTGITRQLFTDMGLTIAYSLLASLIVAVTFVPMVASKTFDHVSENGRTTIANLAVFLQVGEKTVRGHLKESGKYWIENNEVGRK